MESFNYNIFFNEAISQIKQEFENEGKINEEMAKRYESLEQKDAVILDKRETEALVGRLICDDYVTVKNNLLRHDVLKLGMHIFGYLLEESKTEL